MSRWVCGILFSQEDNKDEEMIEFEEDETIHGFTYCAEEAKRRHSGFIDKVYFPKDECCMVFKRREQHGEEF